MFVNTINLAIPAMVSVPFRQTLLLRSIFQRCSPKLYTTCTWEQILFNHFNVYFTVKFCGELHDEEWAGVAQSV